jgi:predicted dehydrogenase
MIVKNKTRRSFLLAGTALVAAPFLSTRVTRALAQASRPKLGFAICGLGGLSTHQIAPALQKTRFCRLAGVITDSPAKAADWQSRYGIPDRNVYAYDTMERMLDNDTIDVVYIVTPNALHAAQAVRAAKAGKHVFCEKPMAVSVAECTQMIEACKSAKRMLGVAYRCQFEPHNLECMRLAREKVFGDIRIVEAAFGVRNDNPNEWRLKRALSGGGALMDVGIYALQATRYLTGEEPILVSGIEAKTDPVRFAEVDESVVWTSRFPSGAVATCSTSYNSALVSNFRVYADQGWFGLDPAFFYDGITGRRSDGKEIRFAPIDQFAAEMDDFSRCILEGKPSRVAGEEGLRDVRILMAIYESIRTGGAIKPA